MVSYCKCGCKNTEDKERLSTRLVLDIISDWVGQEEFELEEHLRCDESEQNKCVCGFSDVVEVASYCHLCDVDGGDCQPLRFLDAECNW